MFLMWNTLLIFVLFGNMMQLSAKEHLKFQSSYATVLKAHMSALKKRERKEKKKAAEGKKKDGKAKKLKPAALKPGQ